MLEMLYAFGIGLAFAVGVGFGALLCQIATKEGRSDLAEEMRGHNDRVEERLASYVFNTEMIATQTGQIADKLSTIANKMP